MSEQRTNLAQEFQDLFQKTAEANKVFLSESAKFVSGLGSGKVGADKLASMQNGLLTDAFNTFAKLSIQYTSNLIDLGLAFTKRLNDELDTKENIPFEEGSTENNKPAFVLKASGTPASTAKAEFLLDSDKKEAVLCRIKGTEYYLQDDRNVTANFETSFFPQSFELMPGQAQKVEIHINIPPGAKDGIYVSNMLVEGFEHSFFTLYLQVTTPPDINTQPE